METAELLARINTLPLRRESTLTRALVVRNPANAPATGRVRFQAAFPIRAAVGPQPVTVWDATRKVLPCRLTVSETCPDTALPPDRIWWKMELEFFVEDAPANGWLTVGAAFGESSASQSDDAAFWETLPLLPLSVVETDCHSGDLPLVGTMQAR